MQWEYDSTDWHLLKKFHDIADKWGGIGWELVTVLMKTSRKEHVYKGFFKRPVKTD